jgi:hypothetical protein
MYAKTLLLLVAGLIIIYVFTRPSREGLCAATPALTAAAIRTACEEQQGVYDAATNTCSCANGTV